MLKGRAEVRLCVSIDGGALCEDAHHVRPSCFHQRCESSVEIVAPAKTWGNIFEDFFKGRCIDEFAVCLNK